MLKEITRSKSITIMLLLDLFGSGLVRSSLFGTLEQAGCAAAYCGDFVCQIAKDLMFD
ncbi:hypothetical protein [Shewanella sp. GutDb-MelDb]|uniref:hypothetical protein n=1 Tax=Shewanella sp. GutDb-MelDb TaxID=2058316 RepID=UPI0015E0BC4B|nr:hypothetical protein [Shewanella sp. GutDb-MelDb]